MTTTEKIPITTVDSARERPLKRRGLFAAAWAVVAAAVFRKSAERVEATSGTGPDGALVIGSNSTSNTANYASLRTELVTGLNFSGTALFESNASPFQSSGSPDAVGVRGGQEERARA